MKSEVYKNKDDNYIKKIANECLANFDKIGKVGK